MEILIQSSAGISAFAELVQNFGLKPDQLTRCAGVPPEALSNPDLYIDCAPVLRLITQAAEASRCEDFGLRLAFANDMSNWGALGLLARQQATVRDAIAATSRFLGVRNQAVRLTLVERGDLAEVRVTTRLCGPDLGMRQAAEASVGAAFRHIAGLTDRPWSPAAVAFRHAPPAASEPYRKAFGAPVHFEQDYDAILLRRADLDSSLPGADATLAQQVERCLIERMRDMPRSLAARVTELAALRLPESGVCLHAMAASFGLSVRTLQRRLAEEGSSYGAAVDAARRRLAQSFVESSDRPLAEVADLLGYSSQSAFTRWYVARHGVTPAVRRRQKA
jgi:AraC-like DNA-binding protein